MAKSTPSTRTRPEVGTWKAAIKPMMVDLPKLWAELGIKWVDGGVTFDDTAPGAGIRKGITASK